MGETKMKETITVFIIFSQEPNAMQCLILKDNEYDRNDLLNLLNWFENEDTTVFKISKDSSNHCYISRNLIRYIKVYDDNK